MSAETTPLRSRRGQVLRCRILNMEKKMTAPGQGTRPTGQLGPISTFYFLLSPSTLLRSLSYLLFKPSGASVQPGSRSFRFLLSIFPLSAFLHHPPSSFRVFRIFRGYRPLPISGFPPLPWSVLRPPGFCSLLSTFCFSPAPHFSLSP